MLLRSASTRRIAALAAKRWMMPPSSSASFENMRTRAPPDFAGARCFGSAEGDEKEGAPEGDAAAEGGAPADEAAAAAEENKEAELEGQVKDLRDQLLRAMAEQENIRSISRRDVDAAKQYAIKSFAKSLLETADNLNRALDAVPEEFRTTDTDDAAATTLANLYEGVAMTRSGLAKALEQHGVKSYSEQPGEPFDPNRHNALMRYPDPTKEPNTVGQVISCGYTLRDRVLRPAEVGVVQDTK